MAQITIDYGDMRIEGGGIDFLNPDVKGTIASLAPSKSETIPVDKKPRYLINVRTPISSTNALYLNFVDVEKNEYLQIQYSGSSETITKGEGTHPFTVTDTSITITNSTTGSSAYRYLYCFYY